jgi:hypothetical protein
MTKTACFINICFQINRYIRQYFFCNIEKERNQEWLKKMKKIIEKFKLYPFQSYKIELSIANEA